MPNILPVRPLSFLVLPIISEVLIFLWKEVGGSEAHEMSVNLCQPETGDDSSLSLPTSTDQDISTSVEPVNSISRDEGATSDFKFLIVFSILIYSLVDDSE